MTRNALLITVLLIAACATTPTTPPPAASPAFTTDRVEISRFNGQFVGTLRASSEPVVAWLRPAERVTTADQKVIAGISYSGKTQDDSIDVEVVAIAEDGAQIPVTTYRVKPGQSVSVDLSNFGLTPMTLRGFVRPTEQ